MDWSIHLAADAVSATTSDDLMAAAIVHIRDLFAVSLCGIVPLQSNDSFHRARFGIRQSHADEYAARWVHLDVTRRAAIERQFAVRAEDPHPAGAWKCAPICADFGRRLGVTA